jgi:hypothetical protein
MSFMKPILRWSIPLVGLLFVGPLAGMCIYGLRAADGSNSVTPMLASPPVMGMIMGIAALLIAGAFGAVATWINGLKSGYFTTGLVLAWATWAAGNMDDILRRSQSSSTMWKLAAEGAILGAIAVGVAFILHKIHEHRLHAATNVETGSPAPTAAVEAERVQWRQALMKSAIAAIPVMGIVVAIVATEPLKGQAFAAATIGSLLAVVAGKWSTRSAPVYPFIAIAALFAVVSPILATFYHTSEQTLIRAALAGNLFPLARLVPLDWLAGAFVGVPMGLNMAAGLFESQLVEKPA